MDKNTSIKSSRLLAVEGKDECNFFKALLKILGIETVDLRQIASPLVGLSNDVQLVDIGGISKFHNEFSNLYNLDGFNKVNVIGFIRDAEKNPPMSAFDSICEILKKFNMPIPRELGIICKTGRPYTAIFVMPDNAGTGMLENLCLKTIESNPSYGCVIKYVECFSQHQNKKEEKKFNEPKSKVQAYLASRSPIVNSLGLGALNAYWNFHHVCLNEIKEFLKSLFPKFE